ncbi:hypothetical protein PTSG_11901 [Salpingoeca rosetta]|uniref:Pyrroline-5-carboxylate reductase n=1 Tax=Salpingoeca rosetta (strain ATCC 50818 / BSB-021) TaxID=946362 RepID=F2U2Y4_SALR5|nr:uncharacterized protein PTSG_11901 [Salpingoeca rosetta]EGD81978.1 hypothetical protein PTSG_11901 [Salpingoeca rosetta]|eukprot:XP_004996161.1 hypothetical protein PTSG_11901 [Salpingoeca rosetta]
MATPMTRTTRRALSVSAQASRAAAAAAQTAPRTRTKIISPATIMRGSSAANKSSAAAMRVGRTSGRPDLRYHAAKFPPTEVMSRPPTACTARQMHTSTRFMRAEPAPAAPRNSSNTAGSATKRASLKARGLLKQQPLARPRPDMRYHAAKFPPSQMLSRPPTMPSARFLHTTACALRRSRKTLQSANAEAVVEEVPDDGKQAQNEQQSQGEEQVKQRQPSVALKDKKIVFLGSGKMAEAMMGGMVNGGAVEATQVTACDPNAGRRTYLKDRFHILTTANNASAAKGADILILAVKPQTMALVFDSIRDTISKDCLVVSIAAGFTLSQIREGLGVKRVVRAMPNTPALINESITSWTFTQEVSPEQRRQAKELLSAFGAEVLLSDERMLDMATALSGSGPAMCQLMFEAMIDAGVHMGFARDVSRKLVLHTVRGAVNLALASGEHPSMLKNDITSPGGTTAAALYQLERGGMRTVFSDAIWAAYRRSRELGGLDSCIGPGRFQVGTQLELPEELVENLQQATEAISAVKDEIAELHSDDDSTTTASNNKKQQ